MATFIGTDDDDTFIGTSGDDWFDGNGGDDSFVGGDGDDTGYGRDGNDTFVGGDGNDNFWGGDGDDYFVPCNNDAFAGTGFDGLTTGAGFDTVDYSLSTHGWYGLHYRGLENGFDLFIDGTTNTAWADKRESGYDTFIEIDNALFDNTTWAWVFAITGSDFDDTYSIRSGSEDAWIQLWGGDGADSYTIYLEGTFRLEFNESGGVAPLLNGVNIDVANGIVHDDGYGNQESLTLVDLGGEFALSLSNFDDHVIGSSLDEYFITGQGNDTIDGGDGSDLVRYDRSGVTAVNVDLETGVATGEWGGQAFTDTLINIENLRGSRNDGDTLLGSAADNTIDGRGGDDTIDGRDGDDDLIGNTGNDHLSGGTGNDTIDGGSGDDIIVDAGAVLEEVDTGEGGGSPHNGHAFGHQNGRGNGHTEHRGRGVGHDRHHNDGEGQTETRVLIGDDDLLTGGTGADTFIFGLNNGEDTIADFFVADGDVIDLTALGLAGFSDLLALADDQGGTADVTITLSDFGSLTLNGLSVADLTEDSFLLV